jgi:hypothetical protein
MGKNIVKFFYLNQLYILVLLGFWIFFIYQVIFIHYFATNFSDSFVFLNFDPPAGLGGFTKFRLNEHFFGDLSQTVLISTLKEPYIGISELWQPCCSGYNNPNTPMSLIIYRFFQYFSNEASLLLLVSVIVIPVSVLFCTSYLRTKDSAYLIMMAIGGVTSIGVLSTIDRGNSIALIALPLFLTIYFLRSNRIYLAWIFLTLTISIKVWAISYLLVLLFLPGLSWMKKTLLTFISLTVAYVIPMSLLTSNNLLSFKLFIKAVFSSETAVLQTVNSVNPVSLVSHILKIFSIEITNNTLFIITTLISLLLVIVVGLSIRLIMSKKLDNIHLFYLTVFPIFITPQAQIYNLLLFSVGSYYAYEYTKSRSVILGRTKDEMIQFVFEIMFLISITIAIVPLAAIPLNMIKINIFLAPLALSYLLIYLILKTINAQENKLPR